MSNKSSFDQGNTIDRREWKRPDLGQNPAPQRVRATPDSDSDDFFLGNKGQTYSDSPVAGKAGVHHLDGENTQYAWSQERGLHKRPEGARQHEHNATADAEPIDPRTTKDKARATYSNKAW